MNATKRSVVYFFPLTGALNSGNPKKPKGKQSGVNEQKQVKNGLLFALDSLDSLFKIIIEIELTFLRESAKIQSPHYIDFNLPY
ncbi:MAG: hypothetical protein FWD58_02870 [Firmicutes bacterium]|nr:hypothetical protein [Bacillota bacterium]